MTPMPTLSTAPRGRMQRLKEVLFHQHVDPGRLAIAVGLGVFVGLTPFYGFQAIIAAALAGLLRLNITAAILATQISNPLFAPFLITASAWIGSRLGAPSLPGDGTWWDPRHPRFYESWLRGGLILGVFAGTLCGLITWAIAARVRRRHRA